MTKRCYVLTPSDVLFFRDGRPMDVDKEQEDVRNIGHGASWPRPDHLFKGVIHALIGERMASLDAIRSEDGDGKLSYGDFGGLRVFGPFPMKSGEVYLPRPLDWDMRPYPCKDSTDLPEPLECGFLDRRVGKKKYPSWVTLADFKDYLAGKDHDLHVVMEKDEDGKDVEVVRFPYKDGDLFTTESRIGNTLDPRTNASKRIQDEHRSGEYQADYLRLAKHVRMWCAVETGKMKGGEEAPKVPESIIMGGQGGIVRCEESTLDLGKELAMDGEIAAGKLVKWTLISPAYFPGNGWLPDFCKDTTKGGAAQELGTVMLRRTKDGPLVGAKLIGACVGKPVVYSGWDTRTRVKPTQMAVPAGSAYLFRCDDADAARALVDVLHLKPRSQNSGQGFGIGVCSLVDDFQDRNEN